MSKKEYGEVRPKEEGQVEQALQNLEQEFAGDTIISPGVKKYTAEVRAELAKFRGVQNISKLVAHMLANIAQAQAHFEKFAWTQEGKRVEQALQDLQKEFADDEIILLAVNKYVAEVHAALAKPENAKNAYKLAAHMLENIAKAKTHFAEYRGSEQYSKVKERKQLDQALADLQQGFTHDPTIRGVVGQYTQKILAEFAKPENAGNVAKFLAHIEATQEYLKEYSAVKESLSQHHEKPLDNYKSVKKDFKATTKEYYGKVGKLSPVSNLSTAEKWGIGLGLFVIVVVTAALLGTGIDASFLNSETFKAVDEATSAGAKLILGALGLVDLVVAVPTAKTLASHGVFRATGQQITQEGITQEVARGVESAVDQAIQSTVTRNDNDRNATPAQEYS